MNNEEFLEKISASFIEYLKTSPRSNKKLKILHGAISQDIKDRLGEEYTVHSLGYGNDREMKIEGRYIDKIVDIAISKEENVLAGIGIKFVMNNYSQNSNNYFENMLGETANIRANKKAYFQIFIIPEEVPYYTNKGEIKKWEKITERNIDKYIKLSNDNPDAFLHTPIKTLVFVFKLPPINARKNITTREKYREYYLKMNNIKLKLSNIPKSSKRLRGTVIFNDYETFIKEVVCYIKSIQS